MLIECYQLILLVFYVYDEIQYWYDYFDCHDSIICSIFHNVVNYKLQNEFKRINLNDRIR